MKVAVVGAGIVGLSTAKALVKRGHEVHVFEQFPLFHDRGSSHGRTRIVRKAYTSAFWTGLMTEAYPMWADLEAQTGQKLVTECGLLYFGNRDSERIQTGIAALESLSVPHEVLGPAKAPQKLSRLRLDGGEVGIFTPEAGYVRADLALRVTYDVCVAHCVQFHLSKGDPHELAQSHDLCIVAAGGWITNLVPDLDVRVTRQTFGYEQTPIEGAVWIDDTTLAYGFPSDDLGAKVGAHENGPLTNPDDMGVPGTEDMEVINSALRDRFGITKPDVQHVTTCIYTSTPDEMFRMGWVGDNILFASCCSGHGFKLGPWTGRTLAGITEGQPIPSEFHFQA
ncbi:MAG: FAD-dependent oxidoreductase [Chthonomonas sp.]|nr:FAD-dependent oxidoreductase [Chthonomonas sp.]